MRLAFGAGLAAITVAVAIVSSGLAGRPAVHRFCASSVRGNFNSDEERDVAIVYSTHPSCGSGRGWFLTVGLTGGRTLRRPLRRDKPTFGESGPGCEAACLAESAPDLNLDGRHEIEVSILQGASQEQRGIYGVVRGRLIRFRSDRGRLSFAYGGSLSEGAYVVCRSHGRVVAVGWGAEREGHTSVDETSYLFHGLRFRLIGHKTKRASGSEIPPRVPGRLC